MKVAFFDFDGTITTKDSLIDFIKYTVGKARYYKGLIILSPLLTLYFLKLVSNNIAKEKLIAHFFKNWSEYKFQQAADEYSLYQIDHITRPQAMQRIRWHQQEGHKVVLVSASMESWLSAWSQKHKLDLIATRLEVKDQLLTGKFATPNCYGYEKVKRINSQYNLEQYDHIYAYGDSSGDNELLAIADEGVYKPFRS